MAFVCSLLEDEDFAELFREGRSFAAKSVIGYDDVDPLMYSIHLSLDMVPGGKYELRYCIEVYDGEHESFEYLWSGAETSFIGKEFRPRVLDCLLGLVRQVVSTASPLEMFICAGDAGIQKAMHKHVLVAKVCEDLGYHVHTFDQYEGQRVWLMERASQRGRRCDASAEDDFASGRED
jgi:hypothetical protein